MREADGESNTGPRPGRVVCLGEALVDLICPERLAERAEARGFEVHFGGALANVAVAAARAGAPTSLAGGCGADEWGALLRRQLAEQGVELSFYTSVEGVQTPFAFAFFDLDGEVHFEIHGDGIDAGIGSLAGREPEMLADASALVFGSNTLVGDRSLAVTRTAAELAGEAGVTTLFDPNLRPGRWSDVELARERCLELIAIVDVLKCNLAEARWLLGEEGLDPVSAGETLLERGPRLVVVTSGVGPAVARGICALEVEPPGVEVVSQLGAGDAFMGTLVAELREGLSAERVRSGIHAAVEAGARACEHLGAFR